MKASELFTVACHPAYLGLGNSQLILFAPRLNESRNEENIKCKHLEARSIQDIIITVKYNATGVYLEQP